MSEAWGPKRRGAFAPFGGTGAVLCLTGLLGCGGASGFADRLAGHRASTFALFGRDDMRAGLRFDVLDQAANKESVKQFECAPLWAGARRCILGIDTGTLTAIVDTSGRVIRLVASPGAALHNGMNLHDLYIFRDVVRDTRSAWDSAGVLHRDGIEGDTPELRWLDPTRRWGGSLWYSRAHRADVPRSSAAATDAELAMSLPESLGVTDLPAYALFTERRPSPPDAKPEPTTPVVTVQAMPSRDEVLTMLRSDLRALTIAEESALHTVGTYEARLDHLALTPSPGVRLALLRPTADGFGAVATHELLPGLSCVVFAGDVASPPATLKQGRRAPPGEVACDSF
jgi:hypothetical protein